MMAQLAEAGKLTLDDVRELEKTIKTIERQRKRKGSRNDQRACQSPLAIHSVRDCGGVADVMCRKNHASIRYWIWFSASIKFLIRSRC